MGLALVVLALARPASERHEAWRTPAQGVEIMLVIDCSGSMQARDYTLEGRSASRLEAVQAVVRDFIEKRTEDALGLVLFGETAALQCPLTDDHAILRTLVDALAIDKQVSGSRTAIGTALMLAADRLRGREAKSRVIVLLTDGENNAGMDPIDAARVAKETGARLFIIGAGGRTFWNGIIEDSKGNRGYMPTPPLNEEAIRRIADAAGGTFLRAADTKALADSYAQIDAMVKTEKPVTRFHSLTDYYAWAVIPALGAIVLAVVLAQTALRRLP